MANLNCRVCDRFFSAPTREVMCRPCYEMLNPNMKASTAGGVKHDDGKPDLSLISYEFLEEMAKVRMFGAKKYSRDNWKSGFKVTRSCAAALRHVYLFLRGETNDAESGLSHLAHAACCLEHAIYDMKKHPENDDRG